MKSKSKLSLAALLLAAATGVSAQEAPSTSSQPSTPPISVDLSLRLADKYTPGRGYVLNKEPAIQPGVVLNVPVLDGNFSVGYIGSMSTGKNNYQEHDGLVSFTRDICKTPLGTLSGMLGHMTFTDTGLRFSEVQAKVKLQNELNPTIFFAHDYKTGDGDYAEFSVTQSTALPLGKGIPFDATLKMHYNNHYIFPGTGLAGMTIAAMVPLVSKDGMSIVADASYFQTWQPERFKSHGNVGISVVTNVPLK